jgi:hypothetical protein
MKQQGLVLSWRVWAVAYTLSLHTDSKACSIAGTTVRAHKSALHTKGALCPTLPAMLMARLTPVTLMAITAAM